MTYLMKDSTEEYLDNNLNSDEPIMIDTWNKNK